MGWLLAVGGILWLAYAYVVVKFVHKILNKNLKFTEQLDPNIKENHKPFERYDRKDWREWEIYIMAVLFLPIRTLILIFAISLLWIQATILKLDKEETAFRELPAKQRESVKKLTNIVGRMIVFSVGFYSVNFKHKKITDVDPSYPAEKYKNRTQQPSFFIANHQSWVDVMLVCASPWVPSFLSKKEVKNYPLFGKCLFLLQSLLVDRDSETNRDQTMQLLEQRAQSIADGKNLPPLIVFPEGTTTNGRYLISFKKGAFEGGYPVRIMCIKYKRGHFNPALDTVGTLDNFFLMASQIRNRVEITVYDTFYPDHLNIKDYKQDWHVYAQAVKSIMAKTLGSQECEVGFRDYKEYYQVLKERIKKIKDESKNKKSKKND